MPVKLFLLFTLALTLALLHALPYLPRPQSLFGLAVPGAIRYGPEGRRRLRRYHLHLLPWTAAAFLVTLWLPPASAALWMAPVLLVPIAAAARHFSRERAEARPLALPAPSTREASLAAEDHDGLRAMLPFLAPLVLLAGTALYLHLHWDRIPARFPIHWRVDGTPNGWATRSWTGVYGPLLLGAILVLFQGGIAALTAWGSRRSAHHPAARMVLAATAYILAAGFSLAGLLPLHVISLGGLLAFHAVSLGFLAVMIWVSVRRRAAPAAETGEVTPDDCWHGWNQFYYNPRDPALFVEKRAGLGWTFNFANRLSWLVLALLLLVPAAVALLARHFTRG